jgi:hypothetical protein
MSDAVTTRFMSETITKQITRTYEVTCSLQWLLDHPKMLADRPGAEVSVNIPDRDLAHMVVEPRKLSVTIRHQTYEEQETNQ